MTDLVSHLGYVDSTAGRESLVDDDVRGVEWQATRSPRSAANDNPLRRDRAVESRTFHLAAPTLQPRFGQLAAKRAIDVIVSGASMVLLAPVLLLIAGLIKLESRGPSLFRQSRTGLYGKPFGILKFRSMYVDMGDPSGVAQTVDDDFRITRIGRLLRRTNLDELPQFWNVFVGDMSLIGPRPHVPGMLAAGKPYEELVSGYEHRHLMRPGLTGLAQCRGLRGPTHNRWKAVRRIVCDVEYVKNFSLFLDAKIVLRTIMSEIRGGTGS